MKNLGFSKEIIGVWRLAALLIGSLGGALVLEPWDALEDYFLCLTECELNDQKCVTSCLLTHLNISDGSGNSFGVKLK